MTTHPHLEGLIRKVEHLSICMMEPQINLLPAPAPQVIERYADQVNNILIDLKALAALPGGGVDYPTEFVKRMRAASEAVVVPKMSPLKQELFKAGCVAMIRALNEALSPTPTPHEADRNG